MKVRSYTGRAKVLRNLRAKRTRATTCVRSTMRWMIEEPAKFTVTGQLTTDNPNGLPSWWPFWSDVLKNNVRDAVRAALELERAENAPAS